MDKFIDIKITEDIFSDVKEIIEKTREYGFKEINILDLYQKWLLGKRIEDEFLKPNRSENYGKEIIKKMAKILTKEYGNGFSLTNLYCFREFYLEFPNIFHSSEKSFLTWTHYKALLPLNSKKERDWYEKEALSNNWTVKDLKHYVNCKSYQRLFVNINNKNNNNQLIKRDEDNANTHLKAFYILNFLGLEKGEKLPAKELEDKVISNLKFFINELGRGFTFKARQEIINSGGKEYKVDLVFYNTYLKCNVLIDFKSDEIIYRDIGQMEVYVNLYDRIKKAPDDNPSIGLILATDTNKDFARYLMSKENEKIFMSKYLAYMPSKEELKREIENAKRLFT